MAVDVAALDHAVVAGGGDGAGNFQGGVQDGGNYRVVQTHFRDQTYHFAVFRNGAHVHLNAGVGAPVDGQGILPVRGTPADDVGIHQLVVLVGFQQVQTLAQTLVFTGDGLGLPGGVFHFRKLLFQHLVFRGQSLIAEHITVVLLRHRGQGGGGRPEGGQRALHRQVHHRGVGNAAGNGQSDGQQDGKHHKHLYLGAEEISHCVSSMISGAIFRST